MKSPTLEAQCTDGVFQILSLIFRVNVSNNILTTQVRINERETELYSTFETFKPLTSRINPSIIIQTGKDSSLMVPSIMTGENSQIYIVQITEKCIFETFPSPLHYLIISPHKKYIYIFIFLSGFPFTDTDNSQDNRGREGTFFHSTLPLPPAHEHSDIYVQLCT